MGTGNKRRQSINQKIAPSKYCPFSTVVSCVIADAQNKLKKAINYNASRVFNKQTPQLITERINIGREESVVLSKSTVPPRNNDPYGVLQCGYDTQYLI